MKYQTKVVLGSDHKTLIVHTNISDPLNSPFFQVLSESGVYNDNGRTITLEKGTNSYFNDKMDASGEL